MIVYSQDGINVTKYYRTAPTQHWVQDDAYTGHYEPADVAHGYFPLVEVVQPSPDHVRSVQRDGDTFTEVWTFDQVRQDERLAGEADQSERNQVRDVLGLFNDYLALQNPTNAQVRDQVGLLTRAVKRLIKDNYV